MADSGTPKPTFKIRLKLNPQIQAAIRSDGAVPSAPSSPASPSLPPPPPPPPGSATKPIKVKKPSTPKPKVPKPPKPATPSLPPSSATSIRLTPSSAFAPPRAPSPAYPALPPPANAIASGSGSTPLAPSTPTEGEPLGPPPLPSQPGSDAAFDGDDTEGSASLPGTPLSGLAEPFVKGRGKGPKKPRIGADGRPMVSGRLQLPLKEVCEKMLREVRRRDDYAFFINPVSEADVPGYSDVIQEPMSLSTMDDKLKRGEYIDFDLFEYDLRLIFTNCKTFNPPETMFHQMATKLQNWVIKHLPTNRALVLPAELAPPPPPISVPATASPSPSSPGPSIRSARTPSMEPGSPAVSASGRTASGGQVRPPGVPGPHKGTGQNQLGKKRGPYKKSRDAVMTAAPVVHQEVMGGTDESGRPRGTGWVDFGEGVRECVKWWETQGRRIKTKKEIAKLGTHPDFVHTLPDSSFNLAELESLFPTLNAFLARPATIPGLLPLPADFLATSTSSSTQISSKSPGPSQPTRSNPSYGNITHDAYLPPAFSWRRAPRPSTTAAPPLAPPPVPKTAATGGITYSNDLLAYYTLDKYPNVDPIPQGYVLEDPYRRAEVQDWGAFPSLHSASSGPQACDQQAFVRFLVPPLPDVPGFFDPLLEESEQTSGLPGKKAAMVRAARAEQTLRDGMYGSHTGEAYAASVERFFREACQGGEGEGEEMLRGWVERDVVRGVFGLGGLGVGRAVGEGWANRGEMGSDDESEEAEADAGADQEEEQAMDGIEEQPAEDAPMPEMTAKAEPLGLEDEDVPIPPAPLSPPPTKPITLSTATPPLPNPKLLTRLASRTIRALPTRQASLAHLAAIRSQPISLSALLHRPEDFDAPIPPPAPPAKRAKQQRRRSASVSVPPEEEQEAMNAPMGSAVWVGGVMKAVGRELAELARDAESAAGGGGARRATRGARAKEEGVEDQEDERLRRVRFLLISLAKFVPLQEMEKMNTQQLELLPAGPVRSKYAQLLLARGD